MASEAPGPRRVWERLRAQLPSDARARALLLASLALGVVLKVRIVFTDDGINWPDEIYQSFEPAHRLVYGYGLVPWEFLEGARTWAVPAFVAVWLWLGKLFGLSAAGSIALTKLAFVALSAGAALGVYRLSRGLGGDELPSAAASALWSLCALSLYFSPRAMSENLAAALGVWGVALVLEAGAVPRTRIIGASLLGLATLARLQMGIVCVGVLLVLAVVGGSTWLERRRAVVPVLITLMAWALVFGLWDAAAWHHLPTAKAGGFFHSAVVYYRFNIVENRGAGWGTAPWTYFFQHLYLTMPAVTVLLGVSLLGSVKRAWGVLVVLALFMGLHLFVSHKELRFVVPAVPLACACVGVFATMLPGRLGLAVTLAAVLSAGWSAWNHKSLTMGDVGSYPERATWSAWDDYGSVNRLMLAAGRQGDVCGLRIDAAHLAWTGGSTYLHANAPLYMPGTPHQNGYFNYVITRPGSGAPVIASEGPWELVKLGPTCNPDPNYSWRLP